VPNVFRGGCSVWGNDPGCELRKKERKYIPEMNGDISLPGKELKMSFVAKPITIEPAGVPIELKFRTSELALVLEGSVSER
jgi:hypothetical protein